MARARRVAASATDAAVDPSAPDAAAVDPSEADAAAFNAARGWCWPVRDIHLLAPPARRAPLPFWRLIGPETRCALAWRAELSAGYRVYALSSLTFGLVGAIAYLGARATALEAGLLAAVGLTSFQADVTYLGVDHPWRTADTLLATGITSFYLARAFAEGSACSLAPLLPFGWAARCFARSQAARTFAERARWHVHWHFAVQAALLLLLFGETVVPPALALIHPALGDLVRPPS